MKAHFSEAERTETAASEHQGKDAAILAAVLFPRSEAAHKKA